MDKILLFIPMYNCEKQIVRVLGQLNDEICEYISEVLIVNNRSTDSGENAIKEYVENHNIKSKVKLIRNKENYGLGGSHKIAFEYATKHEFEYLIVLHGDDQGSIDNLLPYLKNGEYRQYDCMLGARFAKGSKLKGYSRFRTFGNKVFNILFSIGCGKKVQDLGAGLNMYRVNIFQNRYYLKFRDNLSFNCYMLLSSVCLKHKIMFFPITWREDDQVSNVKMVSQSMGTLKLLAMYVFARKQFMSGEHRIAIHEAYQADIVYVNRGIHLVMPMAGGGTRFGNKGFELPKPLIELQGKPFFYWAVQSIVKFVDVVDLTFVVLQDHIERFAIDHVIREYYPLANIIVLPYVLQGAVLTCENGVVGISDDNPILFNDCDHAFVCYDFYKFCEESDFDSTDGALLTFQSSSPSYSYVRFDNDGNVCGTIEKQVVSEEAICGAYFFGNKSIFQYAVKKYLNNCDYAEYFVSGLYNNMPENGCKIRTFLTDEHISFGTPSEYDIAENDKRLKELF